MGRLNWRIIEVNIAEARQQIEEIEQLISGRNHPAEGELQVMLEHAYHHLNVAWNARRASLAQYRHMTDRNFNTWSRFPT